MPLRTRFVLRFERGQLLRAGHVATVHHFIYGRAVYPHGQRRHFRMELGSRGAGSQCTVVTPSTEHRFARYGAMRTRIRLEPCAAWKCLRSDTPPPTARWKLRFDRHTVGRSSPESDRAPKSARRATANTAIPLPS